MAVALFAALSPQDGLCQEAAYYSTDFKTSDLTAIGFAAVDSNQDGQTWTPQTSGQNFRNLDGESVTAITKFPVTIGNYDNDDWLLSPLIYFEQGKTYQMTFTLSKYSYAAIEDGYEVKLGNAKDPGSMSVTLQPLENGDLPQYSGNSLWTRSLEIKVETSGDYCIGFHAIGKPGQKIGIADLTIANGVAAVAPAAIEDLTLTPDPNGAKKVTISFKAPSKTKDGSELESLTKIEINRNGELLKPILDPKPGESQEFVDVVAVSAIYRYSVTAFTASGGGDPVSAETFVGINIPAPAQNVTAQNTGTHSARVTWQAPALDKDGFPIAASNISYDLYRTPRYSSERTLVVSGLTDLSYDDTLPENSGEQQEQEQQQQQFYIYSVDAKSVEGTATPASATPIPLGDPYATPYLESFRNGVQSSIFTSSSVIGNNYWSLTRDFEDVESADGDNGMMVLDGQIGGSAALRSGLINLGDLPSPTLSFHTYNITGCDPTDNTISVTVTAIDGTTKTLDEFSPGMGWVKNMMPLDEFAGKSVWLNFTGKRNNNTELFLDAIAISNIYPHDLKATAINLPGTIHPSENFDITVEILNTGRETSQEYTVDLFCDGNIVDTHSSSGLLPGETELVTFTRVHGIMDNEEITYHAKINYLPDGDTSDNSTEEATAKLVQNPYPVVTDLGGGFQDGIVTLTWSEPDTEKARPHDTLETFEQYDSWATSGVGNWIFVDLDKASIAGFADADMPGIPDFSQQSWWIFDNTHPDFNNGSFSTLSGSKFLASMVSGIQGQGAVQNDDWAISPELYGGPQTVTVNARSYSPLQSELESFEFLYSTGSTDPSDFVSIDTKVDIPAEFTAYTFDLPDEARRFAIRNISEGKMVLMVDDVTYTPVGAPAAFTINGYNVYRDGVRLNSEPVEENEFVDSDAGNGDHTYHVAVLYSAGESQLGNPFNPYTSGVEAVSTDVNSPVVYYNLQGVRIDNPQPGQVYIRVSAGKASKVTVR